jgi:hypothetical protein
MATDYLPSHESEFLAWSENFVAHSAIFSLTFGFSTAELTALQDQVDAFRTSYDICQSDHRTKQQVQIKNDRKKTLKTTVRGMVRRLQVHPAITDAYRIQFHIPIRDTTPTPHPAPTARAVCTVKATGDGKILVEVKGPRPANAKGVNFYWEITDTPDPDPANLRHSQYRNRLKWEFTFEQPDWGKKIHFACAFGNGNGDFGPLSAMISTIVP